MFYIEKTIALCKLSTFFISTILLLFACNGNEIKLESSKNSLQKAPPLTFKNLITNKKIITEETILKQIPEKEKQGFTIKKIIVDNDFALITSIKPTFSLTLKKTGSFNLNFILEKKGFEDTSLNGIIEYVQKKPRLTFKNLITNKKIITEETILKQIPEKEKQGFTIKKIIVDNDFALVTSTKPTFSLTLKKAGSFNLNLTLEKKGFEDISLNGIVQYILKAPSLTFRKLITSRKIITEETILKQIPEKEKQGFTIKKIIVDNDFALVTSTKPTFSLTLKKAGSFNLNLTLEKKGYSDVNLQAVFEKENESMFIFDKATKTISGVRIEYKGSLRTLKTITFPDKIEGVDVEHLKGFFRDGYSYNVFGNEHSDLNPLIETIVLPKNLKTIGVNTFSLCPKLTSIKIPNSLIHIGSNAFYACHSITSIVIPNAVTTIENRAFYNCQSLTSINIPRSIKTIGTLVFFYCSDLEVTVEQPDPTQINIITDAFSYPYISRVKKIRVPKGSLDAYKKADNWKDIPLKIWEEY